MAGGGENNFRTGDVTNLRGVIYAGGGGGSVPHYIPCIELRISPGSQLQVIIQRFELGIRYMLTHKARKLNRLGRFRVVEFAILLS